MLVVDIVKESDNVPDMERLQELKNSEDAQFRCLSIFHRNNRQIRVMGDFRKQLPVQFEREKLPHDKRYGLVGRLDPLDLVARQGRNK